MFLRGVMECFVSIGSQVLGLYNLQTLSCVCKHDPFTCGSVWQGSPLLRHKRSHSSLNETSKLVTAMKRASFIW